MSLPTAPLTLAPAEVITGELFGEAPSPPPLPDTTGSARAAFEDAALDGLLRPPCVVSFSGGRDSSAVLAVAAAVARREGLDAPIPVTLRFPGSIDADETAWQEGVVRAAGLSEWVRLDIDDELDFVGPLAGQALQRHGLLWPSNSHFHIPMLRQATGGTVMTGFDGDTLLGDWRWLPGGRRSARERVKGYATRRALRSLPVQLRAAVLGRLAWTPHWLTSEGRSTVAAHMAATWDVEPRRWSERVAWWWRRRYHLGTRTSLALLGADEDVVVAHPFLDARFVAALGREGGDTGLGDRAAIMRHLFADVLPAENVERRTKAYFDDPMWNVHTRSFLKTWRGEGVDERLVDVDVLIAEWRKDRPHFASATLLQAAWLSAARRAVPSRSTR